VSQAMVSKLESGEYNPTVELLWKISRKLDFDFEVIFSESKKENLEMNGSEKSNKINDDICV